MRRYASWFLALATLAPAVVVLTAVSMVPSSAYALPVFEFSTAKGPLRISAEAMGARRTDKGITVDPKRFDRALERLQKEFRKPPTPGTYELKPDHRVFLKGGAAGYELDPKATRTMLLRALRGSRSNLRLPVREIPASKAPSNALVVVLKDFRLDLYQGPKLTRHFPVGVGALRFPTPPGAYYVREKAINPTWRNPGSPWARSMPSYIGPGPNNPLGTRALRLDRGALVIHGTPQPWTIGQRSSHGCIRMKRPDIEQLFELVPEQTPVFIVP